MSPTPEKDPDDWITGDEPMTGPQRHSGEPASQGSGREPSHRRTVSSPTENSCAMRDAAIRRILNDVLKRFARYCSYAVSQR
ncbi:DUF3072 domain-containing protein [Rhodococcus opacus]|uniref:DUF3072 domain-containing protein n=1 Tax=Rhodococcus opacus TaxID=37919 RepID=UPI00389ABC72